MENETRKIIIEVKDVLDKQNVDKVAFFLAAFKGSYQSLELNH